MKTRFLLSALPQWIQVSVLTGSLLLAWNVPALAVQQDDPFANSNKAPVAPPAQKKRRPPTADRIDFQVKVQPEKATRGEVVRLTVEGKLKPGFHTYPLTMRSSDPAQDESGLSKLSYAASMDFKPLWPVKESEPEFDAVEGVGVYLIHQQPFKWTQDILVLPDAAPGSKTLRLEIKLQVCDKTCVQGEHELEVPILITDAPAVALTPKLKERLQQKQPEIQVVPVPPGLSGKQTALEPAPPVAKSPPGEKATTIPPPKSHEAGKSESPGFIALILPSILAAIAMLLTPCVFPMIPITVSFFLKQSEKEHHNALLTAAVYSLTIILVLTAAVLLLGGVIRQVANDAWLNLGVGALLVFFALSLFGMYEIELPSGLARFTAAHEGKGGYAGALFMALTFTITSFTCTAPFLGPLIVAVKEYQVSLSDRILGAFAYSVTFAAPFFVLALFPSLLKKLPKSGTWLNAVKVVMGFLELAAGLKFLANTDLAWNPGDPILFNYETVLCAWIALSLACGLYLLGLFRLPHDSQIEHLGVTRMLLAAVFFGLALYMVPALWRVTPQGAVGRGLVAFLPNDTRVVPTSANGESTELTWLRDYEKAWKLAATENKLIFIDFTGQNCTNCRYNEKNVFPVPAVHKELAKYVRVQLYTDSVPDSTLSARESKLQGDRNSGWQDETFGDASNPFYAVIRPAKDLPFESVGEGRERLKGEVLGTRKGLIAGKELVDFEQFLSAPQAQQAEGARSKATNEVATAAAK